MTRLPVILAVLAGHSAEAGEPKKLDEVVNPRKPYDPEKGFAEMLDDGSIRVVKAASRVEVIRLKGASNPERDLDGYMTEVAKRGDPDVAGFAIARRVQVSNAALVARIKKLVLNPAAYERYEGTKLCGGFQPKVVFRFGTGDERVDVLICFNCGDVGVSTAQSRKRGPDSYPLADMLTEGWWSLPKEALPDAPFIQKQSPER